MTRVRVGVIGLGEVAQVIHLPILDDRPEMFEIAAICDVSQQLVQSLGDRYRIPHSGRHDRIESLVAQDLDAVMVLTSDEFHADGVTAACRSGKHVFVEKPLCLTMREAETIAEVSEASGVEVMVGYMRRYAPAFLQAAQEITAWPRIDHAYFRDLIGVNRLLIDQTSRVLRPNDVGQHHIRERHARADRLLSDALGPAAPPDMRRAYRLLCGLASHDTSAMRELLGYPHAVVAARCWAAGERMSLLFDYGSFCSALHLGVDQQKRFDASIELQCEHASLRVQYASPYLRQLPTVLHEGRTVDEAFVHSVHRPTFTDAYVYELEAFHGLVVTGDPVKTTVADATEDLRLFGEVMSMMRSST